MISLSISTEREFEKIYEKYVDCVYRVCFMFLKNTLDAQDAVQNVFIKLINQNKTFENENHLKAWLITVAKNECKNTLRHWFFTKRANNEELQKVTYSDKTDSLINEILRLPDKYKLPLYLYYYEGYSTEETAKILEINHSTLRTNLKKAREKLKKMMEVKDGE